MEIVFGEHVNFLNIAGIKRSLMSIPDGSNLTINTVNSKSLDYDIQELLSDFMSHTAKNKQINVYYLGNPLNV
jgi:hypothetical protein